MGVQAASLCRAGRLCSPRPRRPGRPYLTAPSRGDLRGDRARSPPLPSGGQRRRVSSWPRGVSAQAAAVTRGGLAGGSEVFRSGGLCAGPARDLDPKTGVGLQERPSAAEALRRTCLWERWSRSHSVTTRRLTRGAGGPACACLTPAPRVCTHGLLARAPGLAARSRPSAHAPRSRNVLRKPRPAGCSAHTVTSRSP